MNDPFQTLGLKPTATVDEIRAAYHALVKLCHPDRFREPEAQKAAQDKMIRLNLAYEEALKLAKPRKAVTYTKSLPKEEAKHLAQKMLGQQNPESALRYLLRAETRDGDWYYMQGHVLMLLRQYETAHESFREAVKREPNNIEYRRGALDAAVALRKSKTLIGKIKHVLKR